MDRIRPETAARLLPVGRHGWLLRRPGFTGQEVRALLRTAPTESRGRAVVNCAAQVAHWLPPEAHYIDCPFHAWQHLGRIILWYSRGESVEAIGRRLGVISTNWGIERALDTVCARMAGCLNRDPAAHGLPGTSWGWSREREWGR